MSAQEDSFVDERIVSSPSRSSLARQRKYAPRSRNGCLTCKKRRKRCDEGVPHCQNCRRLNHRCVWGDKMPIEYGSTSRPSHLEKESVYQVENSLCIESKFPVAKSQQPIISQSLSITDTLAREHRYLLTFFIQELVPTISVTSSSTTYYTSLYVPMAFHSPAVLCAILAGAAYHLSKVTTDDGYGSRLKQLGMRMQQQCQTILGEYISHPAPSNENCEEIIATLMLLLGMETRFVLSESRRKHGFRPKHLTHHFADIVIVMAVEAVNGQSSLPASAISSTLKGVLKSSCLVTGRINVYTSIFFTTMSCHPSSILDGGFLLED